MKVNPPTYSDKHDLPALITELAGTNTFLALCSSLHCTKTTVAVFDTPYERNTMYRAFLPIPVSLVCHINGHDLSYRADSPSTACRRGRSKILGVVTECTAKHS
ncbi:hypothetical protein EVAR_80924_1 [Eumeta japonica]|uniref:Uncharacterized protein n=1 Tax=Eumeta variegata TaxID=151549 RepID=A0A4C1V1J9_EUMVA|nr:hypothetical protein EVAR_80924_1 [Eumeta japonica]